MHLATLQYTAYLHSRQISKKEPAEATLSLETAIELIMIPSYKDCEVKTGTSLKTVNC